MSGKAGRYMSMESGPIALTAPRMTISRTRAPRPVARPDSASTTTAPALPPSSARTPRDAAGLRGRALALVAHAVAAVRREQVERRAGRDDARRIERRMRHVVVALDLVEVDRLGDPRALIELAQEAREVRVVGDPPDVALEVPDVDGVEANERREQPPVGLGELGARQVAALGEDPLEPVESGEDVGHGGVV